MKQARFYVLVCDGGRAQVYAGQGRVTALTPVEGGGGINTATVPAGERATGHASTGTARYSVDEHGDPRRAIESRFLAERLDWLAAHEAEFDKLVIVAPPRALGEIRQHLPPGLKPKLAAEIGVDLTKAPVAEIVAAVSGALAG